MQTVFRNQVVSFKIYTADEYGRAEDLQILDGDGLYWRVFASESSYTQVEPLAGWNTLDITTSRISAGLYEVLYTVPLLAAVGEYSLEIERRQNVDVLRKYRQEFEVVAAYVHEFDTDSQLCLIRDLRAEGVAITVPDLKLARSINRGDSWLERYCARVFQPRFNRVRLQCKAAGKIRCPEPLCWLQSVATEENVDIDLSSIELNSRYLRGAQGAPSYGSDDRDNCFLKASSFVKGTYYWITGVWGYSEADGSEVGCVPEQIRLAAINLGLKYQASLMGSGSGAIPAFTDRLIHEKTATQEYNLSPIDSGSISMVAGDSELYRILKQYRRPMQMGYA